MAHQIYKIHVLGPQPHIYIFMSPEVEGRDIAQDAFSSDVPTTYVNTQIYPDDTIMSLKLKILQTLHNKIPDTVAIESMYLFCHKQVPVNLGDIYNSLTQNGKTKLSYALLNIFANNIVPLPDLPTNHTHNVSIADFINICNPEGTRDIIVSHPLGQTNWFQPTQLIGFNPFAISTPELDNIRILDKIHHGTLVNIIPTNSGKLIMDTGPIIDNTIYLCFAEDVLNQVPDSQQSQIRQIYFPLLADIHAGMLLPEELNTYDKLFMTSGSSKITNYFNVIDMFYGTFNNQISPITYFQKGIRNLQLCINPSHTFKLSLDILFKILHASASYPLVKYNPSIRQENIYRLYTNKISTDGLKIPYLKKATILRLMKDIGNVPKTVAIYNELLYNNVNYTSVCEITEQGQMIATLEQTSQEPHLLTPDEADAILALIINPIIENIQTYFSQNGYRLDPFTTIFQPNVSILNMAYSFYTPFTTIDLNPIKSCITSVFNNETSVFKTTGAWKMLLRFKRVSNFNKTTSQEAFIMDKIKDGHGTGEIATMLVENFKDDINYNEAIARVQSVVNEQQLRKKSGRVLLQIIDNPGFPVELVHTKTSFDIHDTIAIHIMGINNVEYLNTIPIYIDTLLRLATAKKGAYSTTYPILCNPAFEITKKRKLISQSIDSDIPDIIQYKKEDGINNEPLNVFGATSATGAEDNFDVEDDARMQELIAMYGNVDDSSDDLSGGAKSVRILEPHNSDSDSDTDTDDITNLKHLEKVTLKRFFQNRIKKRDPYLFTTGMGKNYSRECQANSKRQPIALTADELAEIKAQYPDFLRPEDIITYGSDEKHQISYMCPRFWCLKTNRPIDPTEMIETVGENGKKELVHPTCGRILPDKAKHIIPGHYIYEFYGDDDKQYPGLIPGKNKTDSCLPCCFAKWNTRGRLDALKKCATKTSAAAAAATTEAADTATGLEKTENVDYIKGPDKVPLPLGRWGHLPMQLQFFFKEMNIDCQVSKLVPIVKQEHPCIMRHGVENTNPAQSFIACMSNIIYYGTGANIKTIDEMKHHIIASITLDHFITYQNGNLIANFNTSSSTLTTYPDIYKKTRIYTTLSEQNTPEATAYLERIIAAFENFKAFILNPDITIDPTYLWDVFALPNRAIFPKGVNIIIFDIVNNDITNNISIVCPSNYYSTAAYDSAKPTVFIVKQYEFYEPIYTYTKLKEGKIQINKIFMETDKALHPAIKLILKNIVRPFLNTICRPLNSMPNVYHIKTAPIADQLVNNLRICKYEPLKGVLNFNNKVIGIIAKSPHQNMGCYVPCYPSVLSATNSSIPLTLMTDLDIWEPYDHTVTFLTRLSDSAKTHKTDIPCRPLLRVMEDELIVGILTETNQFIQISRPVHPTDVKSPLAPLKNSNYILRKQSVDVHIAEATSTGAIDIARKDYIDRIKKETAFYNMFRNTIKILINTYTNSALNIKNQIIKTATAPLEIYSAKLQKVRALLHTLADNRIRFSGDANYYKIATNMTINGCTLSGGDCDIILPAINLTTGKSNKDAYYTRFADELIRYAHIRNYITEPYNLFSFGNNVGYDLNDDEILLMQSLITPEYFDSLIPAIVNKYVDVIAYDQINPIIHNQYDNVVDYNTAISNADTRSTHINKPECIIAPPEPLKPHPWGKCVASYLHADEIHYTCGLQLISYMIQKTTGIALSNAEIRKQLAALYDVFTANRGLRLITTTLCEHIGLDRLIKPVEETYQLLIDTYKFNLVDMWLLVDKYKIPTIFLANEGKSAVVAYNTDDNHMFCIISTTGKNLTEFRIVQGKNTSNITIDVGECFEDIRIHYVAVDTLLEIKTGLPRVAKARGRPRKVIKLSSSNENTPTTATSETSDIALNNTADENIIEIAAPIRKRGRPRKVIKLSISS